MADYNSSLPVRSEADVDERLQSKIVDFTTPAQGMVVDAQGNAHIEVHGDNPSGSDEVLRLSELGAITPDGVYHATNNTKPGNVGLVAHTRAASPSDAEQGIRVTAVSNSTIHALDVAVRDESGVPYSSSNPMPVVQVESEGDEVNDPKAASAVAAAATDNHDYTVTALKTLILTQIEGSASGKAKFEVFIETGVATNVFTSKFVKFNSTSEPNISVILKEPISVAAGVRVRVAVTNRDNQAQDLYSTISGHEV